MNPRLFKAPLGNVYYAIAFTDKQKLRFCKNTGISEKAVAEFKGGACTHILQHEDGRVMCLIDYPIDEVSIDNIALLLHECVHVYQEMRDYMCEERPSYEFEAYSIQEIYLNCMYEWKSLRKLCA